MTVAQLIAGLQGRPPNLRVVVVSNCDGHPADIDQVSAVYAREIYDEDDCEDRVDPQETVVALFG